MGRLKVLSLFSGCGGMDLGILGQFHFLGQTYTKNPADIVYAVDNNKYAVNIYNANFAHKSVLKDIKLVSAKEIPEHNLLVGGFPCQSFSILAQNPPRLGFHDEKGKLFFEMCRLLKEKQPMAFIAENVKGILSANKRKTFPLIIKSFEETGYHVTYKLLNAFDFGIPQRRERVFIVGFKNIENFNSFNFPKPTTPEQKTPLKEVIFDEKQIDEKYYFSQRAVDGLMRNRRGKNTMNKGRVQNPETPCNTISAHLAKVSLNGTDPVLKPNGRYRRFTPREAARIQSFPDTFKLACSEHQQYRAIGNAVPPVLMWHITQEILKVFGLLEIPSAKKQKKVTYEKHYPFIIHSNRTMYKH